MQKVYDFIWDEFCDWYIEMVKPRIRPESGNNDSRKAALWTLQTVLLNALKLLHPYMPFITEEIYQTLTDGHTSEDAKESVMISPWPEAHAEWSTEDFTQAENGIGLIKEAVRGIRNVRSEMNVKPSKKTKLYVVSGHEETRRVFETGKLFFETLSHASEAVCQADKTGIADDAVSVVLADAVVYIPMGDLVDFEAERARLRKELAKAEDDLAFIQKKLSNASFVEKAPAAVVQVQRDNAKKCEDKIAMLKESLAKLG